MENQERTVPGSAIAERVSILTVSILTVSMAEVRSKEEEKSKVTLSVVAEVEDHK